MALCPAAKRVATPGGVGHSGVAGECVDAAVDVVAAADGHAQGVSSAEGGHPIAGVDDAAA